MAPNALEMSKYHPFWVRTHFGHFKPWYGVIILLFSHSPVLIISWCSGESDQANNLLGGRVHVQRRAMHHYGSKESVYCIWTISNPIYLKVWSNVKLPRQIRWAQLQAPIHGGEIPHFFWSFLKTRRTTTRRFRPSHLTKKTMSTSLSISTSQCPSLTSWKLKKWTISTTWSSD